MLSGYKIIWTAEALKNFRIILKYLDKNWSKKEIASFINKLDRRLNLISANPKLFAKTELGKNVRKSVLTKHTVIYYLVEDNLVKILTMFDPRQNQAKLKL